MIRRLSLLMGVAMVVITLLASPVSAQGMEWDLPPGIAAQVQPLLEAMMEHMQHSGMTPEQMQMMMADMERVIDQLPPGIFLQILKLMPELDMQEMMIAHEAIHGDMLLQEPPGQLLIFIRQLAQ